MKRRTKRKVEKAIVKVEKASVCIGLLPAKICYDTCMAALDAALNTTYYIVNCTKFVIED